MHPQELSPSGAFAPIRRGLKAIFAEDVGNGGSSNSVTKFAEFTFNPFITPQSILCCKADNQLPDLKHYSWATGLSGFAPIILGSNQPAVSPHDRIGGDNRADFREHFVAQSFTEYCQSSALFIGQPDLLVAELLSKNSILLFEVIDCSLLLLVEDSSNNHAEKLPRVEFRVHRSRIRLQNELLMSRVVF